MKTTNFDQKEKYKNLIIRKNFIPAVEPWAAAAGSGPLAAGSDSAQAAT
jgi:hypothetical protein